MTARILLHMQPTPDAEWRLLDRALTPDDLLGSMTDMAPHGRQILMFGWDHGVPGVWRSLGGADVDLGAIHAIPLRAVASWSGAERLADLREGPYEQAVTLRNGAMVRIRWSVDG